MAEQTTDEQTTDEQSPLPKDGTLRYRHSVDVLQNLSYMIGKCQVCAAQVRDTIMGEVEDAWSYCNECGHLVKVANRTRWH